MCDTASASEPRPRWTALYVGFGVLAASVLAVPAFTPPGRLASVLYGGAALVAVVAAGLWVRANRVALDLAAACDCAGGTTVRVIVSSPLDEAGLVPVTAMPHPGEDRIDVEAACPVGV